MVTMLTCTAGCAGCVHAASTSQCADWQLDESLDCLLVLMELLIRCFGMLPCDMWSCDDVGAAGLMCNRVALARCC